MNIDLFTERARLQAEVDKRAEAYYRALGALEYVDLQLAQVLADQQRPAYTEGAEAPPEPPQEPPAPGKFLEG